ncbi:MAG: hypothetical protein RLZZ293_1543 [Pseudomonadota bacterium]|jgi:hypothetical protein
MKTQQTIMWLIINSTLLVSCASWWGSGRQADENIPLPPKNLTNNANNSPAIILPQPSNMKQPNISESNANLANESQITRNKRFTEQRSNGGVVNKVIVNNPQHGLPDYYLAPNLQQQTDTNNNPDKLSPATWQWSW